VRREMAILGEQAPFHRGAAETPPETPPDT